MCLYLENYKLLLCKLFYLYLKYLYKKIKLKFMDIKKSTKIYLCSQSGIFTGWTCFPGGVGYRRSDCSAKPKISNLGWKENENRFLWKMQHDWTE